MAKCWKLKERRLYKMGTGKDIDKMTFEEIKAYVKELENYKRTVESFGTEKVKEYKDLLIKSRIEKDPFRPLKNIFNV